jgi:hypothetical protein
MRDRFRHWQQKWGKLIFFEKNFTLSKFLPYFPNRIRVHTQEFQRRAPQNNEETWSGIELRQKYDYSSCHSSYSFKIWGMSLGHSSWSLQLLKNLGRIALITVFCFFLTTGFRRHHETILSCLHSALSHILFSVDNSVSSLDNFNGCKRNRELRWTTKLRSKIDSISCWQKGL